MSDKQSLEYVKKDQKVGLAQDMMTERAEVGSYRTTSVSGQRITVKLTLNPQRLDSMLLAYTYYEDVKGEEVAFVDDDYNQWVMKLSTFGKLFEKILLKVEELVLKQVALYDQIDLVNLEGKTLEEAITDVRAIVW